ADWIAAERTGKAPLVASQPGRNQNVRTRRPLPPHGARHVRQSIVVIAHTLAGGRCNAGKPIAPGVLGAAPKGPRAARSGCVKGGPHGTLAAAFDETADMRGTAAF